jgi:hypothetical protein
MISIEVYFIEEWNNVLYDSVYLRSSEYEVCISYLVYI